MDFQASKPHSAACERNREPILAVLREHFADRRQVLEVGSGTGQHAVHFAAALPGLVWAYGYDAEGAGADWNGLEFCWGWKPAPRSPAAALLSANSCSFSLSVLTVCSLSP